MITAATLFAGGEGVGIGMKAAGINHLWGIEYDDRIASVARDNGFHTIAANVLDIDPHTMEPVDVLHASPPCIGASIANSEQGERPEDIALGEKIASFIDILRPRIFTLENVTFYRTFEAFQSILDALSRSGYMYHFEHVNMADLGVPQTRRRLILRAIRGSLLSPLMPAEKWRSWYSAIEDLIPSLPDSRFAKWQLKILPEYARTFLVGQNRGGNNRDRLNTSDADLPAFTVTAQNCNKTRAFIANGTPNSKGESITTRSENEPVFTVAASPAKRPIKAFVMDGGNTNSNGGKANSRLATQPIFTVTTQERTVTRAWLEQGRVVRMTPRCNARFQSFPDSYKLPDGVTLASTIVGNAVPPLAYEKIIGQLI